MSTSQVLLSLLSIVVVGFIANTVVVKINGSISALQRRFFDGLLAWGSVAALFVNPAAGVIALGTLFALAVVGVLIGLSIAYKHKLLDNGKKKEVFILSITILKATLIRSFGFNYTPKY